MLAITGMTYHDLIGTHYLQDINQDYLYQDVALYNQRLMGPEHLENVVNFACRAALSNRAVAHVAIPIDIQAMAASRSNAVSNATCPAIPRPRTSLRCGFREQIEQAAKGSRGEEQGR